MKSVLPTAAGYLVIAAVLLASASCAGMGTLAEVLASTGGVYGNGQELSGEIRSIDTRRQELQLQSARGGSDRLRYDGRTEVIYQQRRYSVQDLERGDVVRVLVDSRGQQPYASRIQVQRSVRDRPDRYGGTPRLERFDGSVVRVDTRQGWFELQQNRGPVFLVLLPYDPGRAIDDRFRRLRRGDRIRIEGYIVDGSRIELRRFM
jgi:hypothetical protein